MKDPRRVLVLAAGLALLAACAPPPQPPPDTTADEAALKAGSESWMKAYNSGDADTIVGLYAGDAIMMPPGAPAAQGHDAIREFITKDIANAQAAGVTLVNGPTDAGVCGDMGWHSGSYTVTDASGATVDSGHYSEVWHKSDGQWHIIRDIWNSDKPAMEPESGDMTETPES